MGFALDPHPCSSLHASTPTTHHFLSYSIVFFLNKKEISDDEAAQASGGVDQAATPLPDTANAVVHEFGTWSDGQQLQLVKKLMFKLKHKVSKSKASLPVSLSN